MESVVEAVARVAKMRHAVPYVGAVPADAAGMANFQRTVVHHLERGEPVCFRLEALDTVCGDLAALRAFVHATHVHSIQHTRVIDGMESGTLHKDDKDTPSGDATMRQQAREAHARAVKVVQECGLDWLAGARERLPEQLREHALNLSGTGGGFTNVHRHGLVVVNVCCYGVKHYLLAPSDPMYGHDDNASGLVKVVSNSSSGAQEFKIMLERQGRVGVHHTTLDAAAGKPNMIIWPPGCFHEVYTPAPYIGLHFYAVPPSRQLLRDSALWMQYDICVEWHKELRSAGVSQERDWYRRACASVKRCT
ncbi:hypothetical protein JKP88DRAFT_288722 [Tribonema minus]|uniref:Uncharacterized protein n=1 Tax=Tribonema minus TaxID=303371 RepID=A0A836CIB4_9STRA|nr:hypothetical protein JKP88DRAFT_288722 [Tribonema minus]